MRIALVTTPPSADSPAGATVEALLPALREQAEVDVFVPDARAAALWTQVSARPAAELAPRDYEQIVYALADEPAHAFMLRLVRAVGGTVALHSWSLSRVVREAYPILDRGGLVAAWRVWCEGGGRDLAAYRRLARARRAVADGAAELCLNHSAVRYGDAFLVGDESLRARILESRNAPTPIRVLELDATRLEAGERASVARAWIQALERFPRPRASRRALVTLALQRSLEEARAARK